MDRNKQFDIMLAIGIIMVVMAHSYQLPLLFFPAGAFENALFFFISGYFFSVKLNLKDKIGWCFKKVKTQLIPYFVLCVLFGLITFALHPLGIHLGRGSSSLYNFIVVSFLNGAGYQSGLFMTAWFLFQLFVANIISQWIYWKNGFKYKLAIFAILILPTILFLYQGLNNHTGFYLLVIRTFFSLLFFSAGSLLKEIEPKVKKFLVNPAIVFCWYAVVNILAVTFVGISYSIPWGNIGNKIAYIPLITTLLIILIVYAISYYFSLVISEKSFLLTIGRNTYSIMVWHVFILFLVNVLLYNFGLFSYNNLSDVMYRYNAKELWLLYQIPAIVVPIFMAIAYRKAKKLFFSR